MVQIEELGKVIAQIINKRNTGSTDRIPDQIEGVYNALRLDRDFLLNASPEEIRNFLEQEDSGGTLRMEVAIKALIEESYLYPSDKRVLLQRAKELLEFLQRTDNTFSFERIHQLQDIDGLLNMNE